MNGVKHQIAGAGKKDGPATREAMGPSVAHHLVGEIAALRPAAIVTIGNEAHSSISSLRLLPGIKRGDLTLQGASNEEVARLHSGLGL
jgi:hypothetical protein